METAAPIMPDRNFSLGQDVLFLDGEGVQEQMVYKGATPDGQWQTLQKRDGSKDVTLGSYVRLLDQPSFSNIPSTPLDYIGKRLALA
jgi:hypothetical protein